MKKQIPNIITLANLFSGCVAIVMAFYGNFFAAALFVMLAAVFDFFDGFAARLLGVSSKMGVELDSLADMVSFGVAPAVAVFSFLENGFGMYHAWLTPVREVLPFAAFLIPVFSAYRLAKFNIDERQTTSFLGLPTPANALFWMSYVYGVSTAQSPVFLYLALFLIIVLSLLMISEIPMFSLKFKKIQFKGNERQVILVILALVLVALLKIAGIAWGVLIYILLSLLTTRKKVSNG